MKIAVLVPVLSDKDAVGADALGMAAVLQAQGHEVRLFAETVVNITQTVHKPHQLDKFITDQRDILVYHFSYGWPPALEILAHSRARRVVKYHNITPPEFFENISPEHVAACRHGRQQIRPLVALGCEHYLADSEYNLQELIEHGLNPAHGSVLPPFNRLDEMLDREGDLQFLDRYNDGCSNLLMVGRIAPNKGHLTLIDAFSVYLREFDRNARLFLVGKEDPRMARYSSMIRESIARNGIKQNVYFLGGVSDAVLKSAYLVSDAFVILSEHEGFCVPLAEAMALKVPIVAFGSSAVPWTVGDAGIVWDSRDPALYACTIQRVRQDARVRSLLQRNGARRYRQMYSEQALSNQLRSAMESLA